MSDSKSCCCNYLDIHKVHVYRRMNDEEIIPGYKDTQRIIFQIEVLTCDGKAI